MKIVQTANWLQAERMLAERLGVAYVEANAVILQLLRRELDQSDFEVPDVERLFSIDHELLVEFGFQWYRLCEQDDLGEEWNPDEGPQQDPDRMEELVGVSQGFLLTYAIFFLCARELPDLLLPFLRRRRMPHATSVAASIRSLADKLI